MRRLENRVEPVDFLVEFEVNIPDRTQSGEIQARDGAEASAAARLVNEGHLLRLWRVPAVGDETKAVGLYRADSEAQLIELLRALPLSDWMNVTVTALEAHPNDPGSTATVAAAPRSHQ